MKPKDLLGEKRTFIGLDIAEVKGRPKRINLAIHRKDFLLHVVTIPYMKDKAVPAALESLVNQYVAFAGIKTIIAWEKVSEVLEAGERRLKVLLAVARKDQIDNYISVFEKAGLLINAITFPSLAGIQALKETSLKSRPKEKKMFVGVDDHQTFIHILEGGAIIFIHTLNLGARDFLPARPCLPASAGLPAGTAAGGGSEENLNSLRDDLQKILHAEKEIKELVFHSSDDKLKDQLTSLGEKLGLSTQVEQNMIIPGLAKMKNPKINLLPREVRAAEEWRQQISYFLFSVLGLSLFMLFLFFMLYLGGFVLDRQIQAVQTELDKPTEQFVQLKEIEDKTNEIKNLLAGRKRIAEKSHDFPWDDVFNELTEVVPSNVYLTRVEVNQEEAVIISGVAASSDYIFDFVRKLKEARHFKNVDLQVVRGAEEAGGMTEFSISTEKK